MVPVPSSSFQLISSTLNKSFRSLIECVEAGMEAMCFHSESVIFVLVIVFRRTSRKRSSCTAFIIKLSIDLRKRNRSTHLRNLLELVENEEESSGPQALADLHADVPLCAQHLLASARRSGLKRIGEGLVHRRVSM